MRNSTLAEKFSTNCGISCKKLINGEQFKVKMGKNVPFLIENVCPVSGDCMMESTLGALTNIMFAAPQSSNAKKSVGVYCQKKTSPLAKKSIRLSPKLYWTSVILIVQIRCPM